MEEPTLDPANPIVRLCVQGMEAEFRGDFAQAETLFEQAWRERSDAFEACIAAHYVARSQSSPERKFHWDSEALRNADLVADDRVRSFYPSLYLNLGHSCELLDRREEAYAFYVKATEVVSQLPDGAYGDTVRSAIHSGFTRTREVCA